MASRIPSSGGPSPLLRDICKDPICSLDAEFDKLKTSDSSSKRVKLEEKSIKIVHPRPSDQIKVHKEEMQPLNLND